MSVFHKNPGIILYIINYFFIFIKGILSIFHKILYTRHITLKTPEHRRSFPSGQAARGFPALILTI